VVFGMPREAVRLGAAVQVLPLNAMTDWLNRASHETPQVHT
jgi:chemotaxis response regulator CheB